MSIVEKVSGIGEGEAGFHKPEVVSQRTHIITLEGKTISEDVLFTYLGQRLHAPAYEGRKVNLNVKGLTEGGSKISFTLTGDFSEEDIALLEADIQERAK